MLQVSYFLTKVTTLAVSSTSARIKMESYLFLNENLESCLFLKNRTVYYTFSSMQENLNSKYVVAYFQFIAISSTILSTLRRTPEVLFVYDDLVNVRC